MKLVIVESPYSGKVERNERYLRAAMHDCLTQHDEAPYASHGLYTQPGVLDDDKKRERKLGMEAGFEWIRVADYTVVYMDLGVSGGMQEGIDRAKALGKEVVYRSLGKAWDL